MPTRRDRFGLPVTTALPATVEAVDRFSIEVLSHGKDAGVLLTAAEADPDCAVLQAYAGALGGFKRSSQHPLSASLYGWF
jgi:hypothetical protein